MLISGQIFNIKYSIEYIGVKRRLPSISFSYRQARCPDDGHGPDRLFLIAVKECLDDALCSDSISCSRWESMAEYFISRRMTVLRNPSDGSGPVARRLVMVWWKRLLFSEVFMKSSSLAALWDRWTRRSNCWSVILCTASRTAMSPVGPACIGIHDFLIVQLLHDAAVGMLSMKPSAHAPECLTHRRGADSQLVWYVLFLELVPGGRVPLPMDSTRVLYTFSLSGSCRLLLNLLSWMGLRFILYSIEYIVLY